MPTKVIIGCLLVISLVIGYVLLQKPIEHLHSSDQEKITIKVTAEQHITPTFAGPETVDGTTSHWFYSKPITIEEDTNVSAFSVHMEGAPDSILHHVSVVILNRPALICGDHFASDGGGYEIYSASRNSLDDVVLPKQHGVPLFAGDQLLVEFMAHPQADAHSEHNHAIKPTLVVTLETDPRATIPVEFVRLRLDDSPCTPPLGHQAFLVPTSTTAQPFIKTSLNNADSSSFTFAYDTTIVQGGGNFWVNKGGQNVIVKLNQTIVDTFTAEPGPTDTTWNIPLSSKTIAVPALSTIEIESTYVNPFTVPVADASGMYGFYYRQKN